MLAKEQKKKARNYELERIDDVSIREMRDPQRLSSEDITSELGRMGETIQGLMVDKK